MKEGGAFVCCADICTPNLRKVREGWGTPSFSYASESKGLGPPSVSVQEAREWITFGDLDRKYERG